MRTLNVLPLLLTGCMFSPANGDQVCGANKSVNLSGWVPAAGASITFMAAPDPDGPWTIIGGTNAATQGYQYAGSTYYSFSAAHQIPVWTSDGATLKTYVRARYNGPYTVYLATFDAPGPGEMSGISCFFNRVGTHGDSPNAAIAYCDSDSSPIVELSAPALSTCPCTNTAHVGALVIDSPIKAADYVCLTQVDGNMTITDGAPEVTPFPSLTSITGSVDFSYSYPFDQFGTTVHRRRTIDLPALTTIGGSALLTARRESGNKAVPQGMGAVTSVGGDITMTLYDANPQVFNALANHTGDITIQGFVNGALDINAGGSFQALTSVTGNLLVRRFFAANGFFNSVGIVDGDVTVGDVRLYPSPSFTSLASITGDLIFDATKQLGPPWPTPSVVGGSLQVRNLTTFSPLSSVPADVTTADGLRLENNVNMTDLTNVTVQLGTGDVYISGNTALSQCEVDAFLAAQTAGGWSGTAFVSDTVACP